MKKTLSTKQARKEWQTQTKLRMVSAFGKKCCICGYSKCIQALEFHHLNPGEKDFNPSRTKISPKTWEKICRELRKCVMLCANCHREVHQGMRKIPKDAIRFDESFADYTANTTHGAMDKCPVCKKPKMKYHRVCSLACAAAIRNRINWDKINLAKLLKDGYTTGEIGDLIGVSDSTVRKRISKLGLRNIVQN